LTTGHLQGATAPSLAQFRPGQTLALYMGVARYAEVAAKLIALGHDPRTPAAIVESGTLDTQRVIRTVLGSLDRAQRALRVQPPALLLVGETTRFAERYAWFEPRKVERFEAEPFEPMARVSY
jgi:siroheme synthase